MEKVVCFKKDLIKFRRHGEETQDLAEKIESRQAFYSYPEADHIIKSYLLPRFKRALDNSNDRGLIYFLHGDYHTGKSFLLKFFCALVELLFPHYWMDHEIPIVKVNLNNQINSSIQLLVFLLDKLGHPINSRVLNEWDRSHILKERLQGMLIEYLIKNKTRVLILDECQKLLKSKNPNVADIFELLKDLSTKSNWNGFACPQIVLCGTKDGVPLLEAADWIQGRTRVIKLHPLTDEEFGPFLYKIYKDFISLGISEDWPLVQKVPGSFQEKLNSELAPYLFKRTKGKIGLTVDLIRYATVFALDNGRLYADIEDYEAIQLNDKTYLMGDNPHPPIRKAPKIRIRITLQDRHCKIENCIRNQKPYSSYYYLEQHYLHKHPHVKLIYGAKDGK